MKSLRQLGGWEEKKRRLSVIIKGTSQGLLDTLAAIWPLFVALGKESNRRDKVDEIQHMICGVSYMAMERVCRIRKIGHDTA